MENEGEERLEIDFWGLTDRGKPRIFCQGFSYIRDKTGRDGIIYWKCSQSREG